MKQYSVNCNCKSITVNISLPNTIESYQPRACDCDFCQSHNLSYLSDKDGTLSISPTAKLNTLKQGSQQASFLQCANCLQVVAVTYYSAELQKGAVSSELFSTSHALPEAIAVSPKRLSESEKVQRWSTMWLTIVA
ncbi:hypothetical protein [Aliiglaciecola lipolytica]|uniref:hypothetical protein n=1 Tax=Aliiglaciecola lipolytica TaxID=477689 RepID=UPI0006917685|nr:hypothetical protein [Aliiglaciecola lipolytica]